MTEVRKWSTPLHVSTTFATAYLSVQFKRLLAVSHASNQHTS